MNNINDVPAFQVIDSSVIEDSKVVLQSELMNAPGPIILPTPPAAETVTVSAPCTTISSSNASVNAPPVTSTPPSTSAPTASSIQGHAAQTTSNHTPKGAQMAASTVSANMNHDQILTKTRLQDLVKEIDPCEQLDEEVEDLLLQLVDDFVTSTVNTACVFAKHRNANSVEVKDVQLYLEKMYNMWIPGFGTEEVKPYKKPPMTEAHKQRLALIRKSLRKY